MEDQLERAAVAAIASLGKRGRTSRVPQPVREAVLAYVREARTNGREWSQITSKLGLSQGVLRRWQQPAPRRRAATLLRPVSVKTTASTAALSLVTPAGFRLQGLTVETAAELLRRLS